MEAEHFSCGSNHEKVDYLTLFAVLGHVFLNIIRNEFFDIRKVFS